MRRIECDADIATALEALCKADPRLNAVRDKAAHVPLRRVEPGFASLASIVVSQQVSRASADAIFARLTTLIDPLVAEKTLAATDDLFRIAGLSRPKQQALRAAAQAVVDRELNLDALCRLGADEAIERMVAVRGIGPWTAQIYLLFAGGHPDIFPAGDIALQAAVGDAFGLAGRPDAKQVAVIARSWRPWRGTAARLFWAYYRETKGRDVAPAGQPANRSGEIAE